MTDPAKPTDPDSTPDVASSGEEFEVQAHAAAPLGLQELDVRGPDQDSLLVVTSSATSVAMCS
ncbi:hypothetical protein [Streptomyces sp. NBC_01497]|uniref:hypothetical protein n=1 Tax=Streptomyces sp. NBC_01497 TaxID=2903885 RepID=UPI002E30DFB4|nr:hypothetical protein [Streptomyces sp. NBC_01497]